jgi:hypothetical protein
MGDAVNVVFFVFGECCFAAAALASRTNELVAWLGSDEPHVGL